MTFNFGQVESTSWLENQCRNACMSVAPTSECFHSNMGIVVGSIEFLRNFFLRNFATLIKLCFALKMKQINVGLIPKGRNFQ